MPRSMRRAEPARRSCPSNTTRLSAVSSTACSPRKYRPGRQAGSQPGRTDPLGRDRHYPDGEWDQTVQIPGEIDVQRARRILEELRRRLGETNRPQVELDYIERLLKDY